MLARAWALLLGVVGLGLAHAWWWLPFLADDALISARYAKRLAEGSGLTWNDADRVEGYSDLLWVLATAALHTVGVDPIDAMRALGLAGFVAALVAVGLDPTTLRPDPRRVLAGSATLAATGPLAIWAIGGLEHTALAGVTLVGLVATVHAHETSRRGATALAALAFASATWLRADGVVLPVAAALGWWLALGPGRGTPSALTCLTPAVAASVAQLAFRVGWHGDIVPNTARAKVSLTAVRAWLGVQWAAEGLLWSAPQVAGGALGALAARERGHRWIPPATVAVVWTVYVALVGGDLFPGWRQLVPGLAVLALLAAEGAAATTLTLGRGVALTTLPALALLATTLDPTDHRASAERWEWEGVPFAAAVLRATGGRPATIAVDSAGTLPYFTDLPVVDMLGLNDRWLALHPPERFGGKWLGHDLGNGDYVLSRRPDLVTFGLPRGQPDALFTSAVQLTQSPIFADGWAPFAVRAQPNGNPGYWYVRRDGLLGEQRTEDEVTVPGGWLAAEGEPALVDGEGRVVATVRPGEVRTMTLLLGTGAWTASADTPGVQVTLGCGVPGGEVLALTGPRRVVVVARSEVETLVRSITVRRVEAPADATRCRLPPGLPLRIPVAWAPSVGEPPLDLLPPGVSLIPEVPLTGARVWVRLEKATRATVAFRHGGQLVATELVGRGPREVGIGPPTPIDEIVITASPAGPDRLLGVVVRGDPFPPDPVR
ncbi:MAG: hypothetical protein H6735_19035 [Alphaproteobacteria bacterium]|nr:hypothetical protein [Alphaproteobacteria bacterium]